MMLPLKKFIDFVEQNRLFEPDGVVLAAVSGGMDSVLMVHLLKAAGYPFAIAHCNFQLRGDEALADQAFCRELANQNNVQFHTINFDTQPYAAQNKISIQMAARQLRYNWFEELRQQHQYAAIALAHHQNDAIETILLNLVRGTGIAGLHGILPKNGSLVRPLLFLTRDEIEQIINVNALAYVEDSSNASTKYPRNKLRHEVIPKLRELNPSLESTFQHNLERFKDLETLLELRVAELRSELLIKTGVETRIAIAEVKILKPQRLLLYKLLQPYGFNEAAIADVISSLDKHAGRVFASATYQLILDRDNLIIAPTVVLSESSITITDKDTTLHFNGYKLHILHDEAPLIIKDNPMAISVDAGKLIYPLTVRTWQQSDSFYPIGMKKRKKLSDFFVGLKIPVHQKTQIPLLVNGNGDIVWIGGYRPDDRYKVTENTKKVTIFELFKV